MRPKRIAFYGNFGDGNLGKELTLQTVIEHTRRRWPDAELECICTGPEDVRARHGIAAFCSWARGSGSWRGGAAAPAWTADGGDCGSAPAKPSPQRGVARRLAGRLLRSVKGLVYKLPLEVIHWAASLRVIARSDLLIVPGTGIVTDHRCGPWTWPYELFKYCALAGLCRVEIVFLSVGAGPIHQRISRRMIARSLALARYRSYRDQDSKRCIEGIGVDTRRDAVCPDLVFGLAAQSLSPGRATAGGGKVVGLGLKDYAGPGAGSDEAAYGKYLETMAAFVSWLGTRGYTVRLLIGDLQYDSRVRRDLCELLASRHSAQGQAQVLAEPIPTVAELMRQLAETDVVISPRLQNLTLALMLGKPVIGLGDLEKVAALLGGLELAEYCLPLASLDAEGLGERLLRLESDAVRLESHIRERVGAYRNAVERQYAEVFVERAPAVVPSSVAGP
jgi:polysaccharide pyruvyl transferase WcaK-like protein